MTDITSLVQLMQQQLEAQEKQIQEEREAQDKRIQEEREAHQKQKEMLQQQMEAMVARLAATPTSAICIQWQVSLLSHRLTPVPSYRKTTGPDLAPLPGLTPYQRRSWHKSS